MENENMEQNETQNIEGVVENTETQDANGIQIADDVVAVIAGVAVAEVPGVAGISGGFAIKKF